MRTLTGMLAMMLMVAAAYPQAVAGSKSLFRPCTEVLSATELESLPDVVAGGTRGSANCLRLTNKEFVVFSGGGILKRLFNYCDSRRVPACEWEPFVPYSFDVVREFTGAKGKRYMLWKTWQCRRGVYDHGYGIASLVPKSVEPSGFAFYPLASGVLFRGEDPTTSDPCQDLRGQATEITGYELWGEGTRM